MIVYSWLNMFMLARFHLGFGNIPVVFNRWCKVELKYIALWLVASTSVSHCELAEC